MKVLGVDTGGTFTDFILIDEKGTHAFKIPSTPKDPSIAFMTGLARLNLKSLPITHGSTVATNALLEGKGADVLFVVTAGFKDLLTLGRQNRPRLYALHPQPEGCSLPVEKILEVRERTLADGQILVSLGKEEVERVLALAKKTSCSTIAICLLHSYANPKHEKLLEKEFLKKGYKVSCSSTILPEYREFERASTTVVNAMVSPVMGNYLERLQKQLFPSVLKIMQSNGGTMSSAAAGKNAVHTVLSGPAGGMAGAFHIASPMGFDKILTFDMGGTSTDVGLCDGSVPTSSEACIAGWPIKIPMIDIHTIGSGGGSIAAIDAGGALKVGPASAGADPGPVCYGKGNAVTVTDANFFLGRLLPDNFVVSGLSLNRKRCRLAMEEMGRKSGLEPQRLAEGILEVVEENMAAALRVVSVQRGHDPRHFTLFPFGGAGGLHACALAEKLGMRKVFIPLFPGLLSAVGMLLAAPMRNYSVSFLSVSSCNKASLEAAYNPLTVQASREMLGEGVKPEDLRLEYSLDLRYKGQSFEINVPWSEDFISAFHQKYAGLYGHCHTEREVEIVTLRLKALGKGLNFKELATLQPRSEGRPPRKAEVVWDGQSQCWRVFHREQLAIEEPLPGPALIIEDTATHLLAPGWTAVRHPEGHLLLEKTDDG